MTSSVRYNSFGSRVKPEARMPPPLGVGSASECWVRGCDSDVPMREWRDVPVRGGWHFLFRFARATSRCVCSEEAHAARALHEVVLALLPYAGHGTYTAFGV